jgi:hypothetical protein
MMRGICREQKREDNQVVPGEGQTRVCEKGDLVGWKAGDEKDANAGDVKKSERTDGYLLMEKISWR